MVSITNYTCILVVHYKQYPLLNIKVLFIRVLLLLGPCFVHAQTSTAPALGDGTAQYPYHIATLNNLYWLSQTSSQWSAGKYFIQTANIDASATSGWFLQSGTDYYGFPCIGGISNIGGQKIGNFLGNYNGQGFSISNLYIRRPNDYIGLFGRIGSQSSIKNLVLLNPTVIISSNNSVNGAGILIGNASGATIDNVTISGGTLTSNNVTGFYASLGTIVGWEEGCTISNTSTSASINSNAGYIGGFTGIKGAYTSTYTNCKSTGNINSTGSTRVGGFLGLADNNGTLNMTNCAALGNVTTTGLGGGFIGYFAVVTSTFSNCYAKGNVTIGINGNGGGFFGYSGGNTSTLNNCYSTGSVTGSSTGGFGNYISGSFTFSNCFWDTQTSGKSFGYTSTTPTGLVGKTTANLTNRSTFTNATWDFIGESANGTNDYWIIDANTNGGYPFHTGNIRVWNGSADADWTNANNWDLGVLPSTNSIIQLKSNPTNFPSISTQTTIDRFDFNNVPYILTLGNVDLIATNGVLGFSNQAYVRTNGSGVLKINVPNNDSRYFPIGNAAFDPLLIGNVSGNADDFSVKIRDEVLSSGTTGTAINAPKVNRTWDISKSGANGGSGISLLFAWNTNEEQNGISTYAANRYDGSTWSFLSSGTYSSTLLGNTRYLRHAGYTGPFSPFSIGSTTNSLPLIWTTFTGAKTAEGVELKWSTTTEMNTNKFEVEQSINGITWKTIGAVLAAGNSTTEKQYHLLDINPSIGTNYYRIKQFDLDNQYTYSKIISVLIQESKKTISVFPNPAHDLITFYANEAQEISLLTSNGKIVWKKNVLPGKIEVAVSHLAKGLYILRSKSGWQRIVLE